MREKFLSWLRKVFGWEKVSQWDESSLVAQIFSVKFFGLVKVSLWEKGSSVG